jgi:uncharacterized protein
MTVVSEEKSAALLDMIDRVAQLLPAQGPITAFVFLNTLQALEDLPFDVGVQQGGALFQCEPYLTEARYREKLDIGRIRACDISAVLRDDLQTTGEERIANLCTRFELRSTILQFPLRIGPAEELQWHVAETDSLRKMRPETPLEIRASYLSSSQNWLQHEYQRVKNGVAKGEQSKAWTHAPVKPLQADFFKPYSKVFTQAANAETWEAITLHALWRICREGTAHVPLTPAVQQHFVRLRESLLAATGIDTDQLINEVLIRFSAAFTDQGFADWSLPHRELGYFGCFIELYRHSGYLPEGWRAHLATELQNIWNNKISPMECFQQSLRRLGIQESQCKQYITESMLALKGWAGLMYQMDVRSDRVAFPVPPQTLVEYLAVRSLLECLANEYVTSVELNLKSPLNTLREQLANYLPHCEAIDNAEQRTFTLFELSQILGWTPEQLSSLTQEQWSAIVLEIEKFSNMERRRIFHLAFERRFRVQALDAIHLHVNKPVQRIANPKFQAVFCIDTREESLRRHIEEIDPQVETFGAAGFFVVPMYYRGASDAHFSTLCPVVIRPKHWVVEDVVYSLSDTHRRRSQARKAIGSASHGLHRGSRSFAFGALLTTGLGVLASIPLVARVLFPRITAKLRKFAHQFVETPPVTRLRLERTAEPPGAEGEQVGFSAEEMATTCERMLRDIGLTSNFSKIVMFLGHGSFCLNNPHKSAYDCGACSGGAGGPNARALAAMLNDTCVREILATKGISISRDTFFIGGLHNTCNDSITFSDLDLLPLRLMLDFEAAKEILDAALERNAHERCRRFNSASLSLTPAQAHVHVEGRSEDLAQVRPEFGNATNAMCFVGRANRLRGLYLDRRCFKHSYDPTTETPDFAILSRILGAVVPVCEGINLQYYFSYVDSPGWGCGTKLPHNVTSLLGVMDGYMSDLRSGLPLQGVEIHEPMRLLFVIESTPEAMLHIMQNNAWVGRILQNGWAQLAVLNPHSNEILVYYKGHFQPYVPEVHELPKVDKSQNWYAGQRGNLPFAQIHVRSVPSLDQ